MRWLLLLSFLVSVGVMIFFGARAYRKAVYWQEHRDEPLRPWMSIGYVAHSYHVPPPELFRALGLPDRPPDRRPIGSIASSQNRTSEDVMIELQAAIAKIRAAEKADVP